MAIQPGDSLAHYRIVSTLGAGGMGEVWRAADSKLGREVAIKVLPDSFAADPERLARFEREAKVLASLNHPNIASIYGLEGTGSSHALVLELVEGPTLAERLERGPMALEEVLLIARQIAEALEEAHEKGIVHRDLKPQNVKVSDENRVKVLDFGLAKALDPMASNGASASQLAHSPTLTLGATVQGVILGTAAYMSPEQAKGGAVNERADIWAFGVVLYEMLTGARLFGGDSVPETLAGVLKTQIDFEALPPELPAKLRRLLRRCLERQPKNRLHSIADARIVIEELLRGETEEAVAAAAAPPVAPPRPRWLAPAALAAAAVAGGALALGLARLATPSPEPPRVVRFEIAQPANLATAGAPKLSPDGKHIAFVGREADGPPRVYLRSLDSADVRPLPGTEGVSPQGRPFWSPDSRFVGFFTADKLSKVPIDGGPPQRIADSGGADASWSESGLILYDFSTDDPIRAVPASGGVPRLLVEGVQGEGGFQVAWPQVLPGGEKFLYVAFGGAEEKNGVWMRGIDGGEPRRVVAGLSRVEFAPPDWLLFVRESTLVAQRFDLDDGALVGEPIPVADGLGVSDVGLAEFSASASGVLAYRTVGGGGTELALFDRRGARESAPIETGQLNHPIFSPDGRWLAFDRADDDDNRDVWLRDLRRGVSSRVTFAPETEGAPLFSPDGERLYFMRGPADGKYSLVARPLGVGAEVALRTSSAPMVPLAVSPDGRRLVFVEFASGNGDLFALDIERPEQVVPLTSTPQFTELRAALSPDGRWLAFQSNESGDDEIYVQPFPGPGRKWQVSTAGGIYPVWAPNGREIFYRANDLSLTRVAVEAGASFDAAVPESLFELPTAFGTSVRKIAISPDGERLVALVAAGDSTAAPTSVIVGWDAALPH